MAPDESVLDSRGRVIFFSLRRFISDIAKGNACFICGAGPGTVSFNDEHVLPDWMLKRYKLHQRTIRLPNLSPMRYGQLKIPCCSACNKTMGDVFESPMSKMFSEGHRAVSRELKENGPWRLFGWMSLIFLKTHLKDKYLDYHSDRRAGKMRIGELHSWEDLHHIHCVARAFYTGCQLTSEVMGSLLVLPAKVRPHLESFDYCDLSVAQTMLLRMDETAIIAVFNDSQAALAIYQEELVKVRGPLSPLQIREIAASLASINIQVAERPRFSTEVDLLSEESKILGHRPRECRLEKWQDAIRGAIMYHICKDMVSETSDREQMLKNLKTGRYTFLVDAEGNFPHDHMELAPGS